MALALELLWLRLNARCSELYMVLSIEQNVRAEEENEREGNEDECYKHPTQGEPWHRASKGEVVVNLSTFLKVSSFSPCILQPFLQSAMSSEP